MSMDMNATMTTLATTAATTMTSMMSQAAICVQPKSNECLDLYDRMRELSGKVHTAGSIYSTIAALAYAGMLATFVVAVLEKCDGTKGKASISGSCVNLVIAIGFTVLATYTFSADDQQVFDKCLPRQ